MDTNFDRLKEFLYNERNSDIFDNSDKLYKAFICVEKDDEQLPFNDNLMFILFYECAYRINRATGIKKILKNISFEINQGCSFEDFCAEMCKSKNIPAPSKILPNDTVHERIIRRIKKLLNHDYGWTRIYYSTIQNEQPKNDLTRKIYLSIDNYNLHYFSILLLKLCDKLEIKYNFKIDAEDKHRRSDNVVIYTSDEDFFKYIFAIKSIKNQFPKINFGVPNLLAYSYNEYIGVATIEDNDSTISRSQILCNEICHLRDEAVNFESFFENIKSLMIENLRDTIDFCEKNSSPSRK